MDDCDLAAPPSCISRRAVLILANSCIAASRLANCTLPMFANTVSWLRLLPMAFCCRRTSFNYDTFSETAGGHIVALAHVRLRRFSSYRFQILRRNSDTELFVFFHVSSVFIEVGTGFCPQTAFGREPVGRRLAKCDAGSSQTGGFFPPRRGFSAFDFRIAPAFFCVARPSAQRGLLLRHRAHTRSRGRKPHTAATRASRRGTGAWHASRVDRDDFFHSGKIGTIDPFQAN